MANISLDEEDVGTAKLGDTLSFPNVRSCTAIAALLKSGHLVGGHYTQTRPDNSFTQQAIDTNFLYILREIQQERLKAAYSIYPRKRAYKLGLGACTKVYLLSSAWGYTMTQAEANINMYFHPNAIIKIDVNIPAMDIVFNNGNRQLSITNRATQGNIVTIQNFRTMTGGWHHY